MTDSTMIILFCVILSIWSIVPLLVLQNSRSLFLVDLWTKSVCEILFRFLFLDSLFKLAVFWHIPDQLKLLEVCVAFSLALQTILVIASQALQVV